MSLCVISDGSYIVPAYVGLLGNGWLEQLPSQNVAKGAFVDEMLHPEIVSSTIT